MNKELRVIEVREWLLPTKLRRRTAYQLPLLADFKEADFRNALRDRASY